MEFEEKMEIRKINEFKTGDSLITFFLIRKVECKNTGSGKKYLDIVFGDSSGEIVARLWECTAEDEVQYVKSMLVKIKGTVIEWQGKKQVKIERIRPVKEKDGISLHELVPVAPYAPEDMFTELSTFITKIEKNTLRETVQLIIAEAGEKLLTHPAALQNHHSLRSGLLYHTLTMLQAGEKLLEVYTFLDKDLLFAGIILHDIAKLDEIEANDLGLATDYTVEGQLLGHIVQGVKKIDKAAQRVGLDEETNLIMQHMILSHHYEPEFGSPKRPMVPEAEILHYLDILDARMFDMCKVLGDIQPGDFSERVWVLNNRKIYKPQKK